MIVLQSWLSTGVSRLDSALVGGGLHHEEGTDHSVYVAYHNGLQPEVNLWVVQGYPDNFSIVFQGATQFDDVLAELTRAGFDATRAVTTRNTVFVRNGASTTAVLDEEVEWEVLAEWRRQQELSTLRGPSSSS